MSLVERSLAAVRLGIEEFNAQADDHQQISDDPDTVLFGRNGHLDSMGLVNLLAMVEAHAEDEFDLPVTLADERALSQERNPFRSVEALAGYLASLIEEESGGG